MPKISTVMSKKYAGKPALFLVKSGKIVHIGSFRTKKGHDRIIKSLMKKYPGTHETDFGFTFIFGDKNYILKCT